MFTNKKGRIRNGANDWKSFNLREYLSDEASKTDLYIFPFVVQKKPKLITIVRERKNANNMR